MCGNRLTDKRDSWLLGVLNVAGKSLGKLHPTKGHYLTAVVVADSYSRLWKVNIKKYEEKKEKKKKKKNDQAYQAAFTERNRVGCQLFSPTFIIFSLFIIMLLQT